MATMTIRLPEEKHERLRRLGGHRGPGLNKRFEEWSNVAPAEFDAETQMALAWPGVTFIWKVFSASGTSPGTREPPPQRNTPARK